MMNGARAETLERPIEFPALTGLRGLLAAWVVVYHVTCGIEYRGTDLTALVPEVTLNLLHSGAIAVEMFFVLSGFIMVHVHARDFIGAETTLKYAAASLRFWGLRFIRLWPLHALVLLAYVIMNASGFRWAVLSCGNIETHPATCDRFDPWDLPNQLLMIAGWGWAEVYRWNFVSWSISAEWLAYMCFPLLVLVTSRVPRTLAAVLALAVLAVGVPYHLWLGPTFHGLSDSYSAFRVVPGFLAGCLLGHLISNDASAALRVAKPYLAFAAFTALIVMTGTRTAPMWAIIPGALLILAMSDKVPRGLGRMLVNKPMQLLGRSSYSLYVSHFLVLEVLGRLTEKKRIISSSAPRLAVSILVTLLICALVGWILHRLVEDPTRRRLRALLRLA